MALDFDDMEERSKLQLFIGGQDESQGWFFRYKSPRIPHAPIYGAELGRYIYYYAHEDKYHGFVFIVPSFDNIEEIIKLYLDFSRRRLDYFKRRFPLLCRTLEDGMTDELRFDRGAFTNLDNVMVLAKKVQIDFLGRISREGIHLIADEMIMDTAVELYSLWLDICKETEAFEAAPTLWERIKITTGELLDIASTTPLDFFNPEIYANRQMSNLIDLITKPISNQNK